MVKIVRVPLAEEIRNVLREMILSGVLQPGQRITEQQVAHDVGTSQGPVREAFASLCQEGLLISLPHRGTFVSSVSEAEARMAYALRSLIEPHVMELALPKITGEVLTQLEADIATMRTAADTGDVTSHAAADAQFHGRFYELAGSDVLVTTWQTLSASIRQFVVLVAPHYVPNLGESAQSHVTFLELIRQKDADLIQAEVSEHVQNIWKRIGAATDDDAGDASPEQRS
jgi:DNA-binding GntR family transcriptional regulator